MTHTFGSVKASINLERGRINHLFPMLVDWTILIPFPCLILNSCLVYFDSLDGLRLLFCAQEVRCGGRIREEEPGHQWHQNQDIGAKTRTYQNSTAVINVMTPVMIINLYIFEKSSIVVHDSSTYHCHGMKLWTCNKVGTCITIIGRRKNIPECAVRRSW